MKSDSSLRNPWAPQITQKKWVRRNAILMSILVLLNFATSRQADAQSANRTLYWHGAQQNGNWLEDFCFVQPNPGHCYFDDLDVAVTLHTDTAFGDTYGAFFRIINGASDPEPELYSFNAGAFGGNAIGANVNFPNPPFTLHFPRGWAGRGAVFNPFGAPTVVMPNSIDAHYSSAGENAGYVIADPITVSYNSVQDRLDGVHYTAAATWHIGLGKPPDPNQTRLCDLNTGCATCGGGKKPEQMARYSIHLLLASLHIEDTPVQYNCPYGIPADFQVVYNQREASPPQPLNHNDHTNLGPKWTYNWLSYVIDNPNQSITQNPSVFVRSGGTEVYDYDATTLSYAPDEQTLAVLVKVSGDAYERRFPDGSKEVFAKPDGRTSYPRRVFLTKVVDPAGNETTVNYDPSGTTLRIFSITDALGNQTTINYATSGDPFQIQSITDPFSTGLAPRVTQFGYDSQGRLQSITDPEGIQSSFEYDASNTDLNNILDRNFIKTLTTPYGSTHFERAVGNAVRWLQATDPEGGKERVEFNTVNQNIPSSEAIAPAGVRNAKLEWQNTFYWDKKAMAEAPGDYTKARVTHWLLTQDGKVSGIKDSEKRPLESRVWYTYRDQTDPEKVGADALPIKVARIVSAAGGGTTTQLWQYSYNTMGNLLQQIAPTSPGRVTTIEYAANGIDLLGIYQRNPNGASTEPLVNGGPFAADKLVEFEYNTAHKPLHKWDAARQRVDYVYNSKGQIVTQTQGNPTETTTYLYEQGDPSTGLTRGYLVAIQSPQVGSGHTKIQFAYDGARRISRVTNQPDDYFADITYDSIDRQTSITYLDGTTQEFRYTRDQNCPPAIGGQKLMDLTASKDRMDRWTCRTYNGNRQMTSIDEPATPPNVHRTEYHWCSCGSLDYFDDPNGFRTRFYHDLQGRIFQKIFFDNTTISYSYEAINGVGLTSRLTSITDSLGQITKYDYRTDDNVAGITYLNAHKPTPNVSFGYDQNYSRVASMTDGIGMTSYTYHPVGAGGTLGATSLASVGGPLATVSVDYQYDSLGRVKSRSIGSASETVVYDPLHRIKTIDNPLGHVEPTYVGPTSRIDTIGYLGGPTTTFGYEEPKHDLRLKTIQNAASGFNLSTFAYEHDAEGQVTMWDKVIDSSDSALWFKYNASKQLTRACDDATCNGTSELAYTYDNNGNRLSQQNHNPSGPAQNGATTSYVANTVNQIVAATTASNGLTLPTRTFVNDAVGNMTDDGAGRTFEWDAANRLVAINYLNTGNRSEFAYDGLGRRVKIDEYGAGEMAEIEPQADGNYSRFQYGPFTLPTSGAWTLTLQGLNSNEGEGDNVMLVDFVTLNNSLVANGSFEQPQLELNQDYVVAPAGASWTFDGAAGVSKNGGIYGDPATPFGTQAGFIKNHGSISLGVTLSANTPYTLRFRTGQLSGNASSQRVRVTFRSSSSSVISKTFVWCGNQICEERGGNAVSVFKRFFYNGEQLTKYGANYLYTRDHLGSIREVTDTGGGVVAQYDYDPYGNRVVLTGKIDVDFGYAGYFFHAPSGLNLTLYRAYDPKLGRWLSRDPIGEKGGLNLYAYVRNTPVDLFDPLGLDARTVRLPFGWSFSFHMPFTDYLPGEAAHEQQHRIDWANDPSLPGWIVEQRGWIAQAAFIRQQIAELKRKQCLSEAEQEELSQLENDAITYEGMTTDAASKEYWNDKVRWPWQDKVR